MINQVVDMWTKTDKHYMSKDEMVRKYRECKREEYLQTVFQILSKLELSELETVKMKCQYHIDVLCYSPVEY